VRAIDRSIERARKISEKEISCLLVLPVILRHLAACLQTNICIVSTLVLRAIPP
jgi:hypothetical protein